MNTYLMLYVKSIGQETFAPKNGRSITLPSGQTVAPKSYIAKIFNCSIDKAKNILKTLWRNGLIKMEYNQDIKRNIITIPAVNPTPGTKYVQMQLPADKIEEVYTSKCKYLTSIYMYLTLHARKQDGTSCRITGTVLRGEFVNTSRSIASMCGCCVKTVSNALEKLKELGLLVFEAIKNVAMKVKLLLYPALKKASKKVHEAVKSFAKKTEGETTFVEKTVSPSKPAIQEEKIVQTPVTEDVKYLLFDRKKNKNVSVLNNVIMEVNKAVEATRFPLEKLREALDALYDKNKKEGDNQITASTIISFLEVYKKRMVRLEEERRIETEKEQEFHKQKAMKEEELADLSSSWQLVKKAEEEVKANKGQLKSFDEAEISKMFKLLRAGSINGHTLLERGQVLCFVQGDLLASDGFERPRSWKEDVIAKAILLERLLGKKEISQEAISEASKLDKKAKEAAYENFIDAYKRDKMAWNIGRH